MADIIKPRFVRPEGKGLQRKVDEARAEQLRAVAEFTIALLDHPWNYRTHQRGYSDWRDGQKSFDRVHQLAARCQRCGMEAVALSAWLDIAPDGESIPGPLSMR